MFTPSFLFITSFIFFHFSTGGNSGDEFTIGRDTGSVFLAKDLDWETQREYNLTVRVSDGLFDSVAQVR